MNYFISPQTVFFDKHENKNKIKTFKMLVSALEWLVGDVVILVVSNTRTRGISSLSAKLQSSNLRFDNMSFDWPRVWRDVSLNCLNVIIIGRAHGPWQARTT